MTLEWVRMQINFSEVSFYTDLESFGLPFGIEVSFWPNVGVKTTIKVETTQWRSKNDPPPRIIVLKWLSLVKTTLLNLPGGSIQWCFGNEYSKGHRLDPRHGVANMMLAEGRNVWRSLLEKITVWRFSVKKYDLLEAIGFNSLFHTFTACVCTLRQDYRTYRDICLVLCYS